MAATTIDPEEERLQRIAQRFKNKQGAGVENTGQDASVNTSREDDIPPWEDGSGDVPAADLFPALNNSNNNSGHGGYHAPLPPPTPERDRDGYDRNNWSRLLRQAKDMRPEIAEYLETLYKTGVGLELNKYKTREKEGPGKGQVKVDAKGKPVIIEKFKFVPGREGEGSHGWTENRIKEIMSALYTYMMYLPARKELGQDNVVVQAMEAAIRAGGLLVVNQGGLRFDWSRARDEKEVEGARKLMDGCGADIMSYIKLAERRLKDIGFVVSVAEMCDCVEDFG